MGHNIPWPLTVRQHTPKANAGVPTNALAELGKRAWSGPVTPHNRPSATRPIASSTALSACFSSAFWALARRAGSTRTDRGHAGFRVEELLADHRAQDHTMGVEDRLDRLG